MAGKVKPYSPEERAVVAKHIKEGIDATLARLPGRTRASLMTYASRNGLKVGREAIARMRKAASTKGIRKQMEERGTLQPTQEQTNYFSASDIFQVGWRFYRDNGFSFEQKDSNEVGNQDLPDHSGNRCSE